MLVVLALALMQTPDLGPNPLDGVQAQLAAIQVATVRTIKCRRRVWIFWHAKCKL